MTNRISFGDFFRLIFVLFFLYLMGDAFHRWDGFSYYASFSEFLPGVALVSVLWSIIALIAAFGVWLLFKAFEKVCHLSGLMVGGEHLLLYSFFFISGGALAWKVKKMVWPMLSTTFQLKLMILVIIVVVSIFPAWLLRKRAGQWVDIVLERIVPLVWLFGIIVILSVPLVVYHAFLKQPQVIPLNNPVRSVTQTQNQPNIILVTFDALTARDMSLYGYHRETTPFITEWAKNATVFNMAEAESNFTTSATASLMTGKRVWTHQTYHIEGTKPANSRTESLPSLLKSSGYYNMAFIVNPHTSVQMLGMSGSFETAPLPVEFSTPVSFFGTRFGIVKIYLYRLFAGKIRLYDWIMKNDFILHKLLYSLSKDFFETPVPPEKAFNWFLETIDGGIRRPYFVWIHVLPPHDPYLPPEHYKGFFSPSLGLMNYKTQEGLKQEAYKYLFQYLQYPETMQQPVDLLRDYYDDFIRYCDDQFKDFYAELTRRKELDNTVMILSSDHGESFEHGYFTHGGPFLYEQVTHIPLVIKKAGQNKGNIVDNLVEQIDIPATILDLAGIVVPSWMDGRSLVPLMNGESLSDRPAFVMNFEGNRSRGHKIENGSIAVWEGDYKLIYYLQRKESLLFNLRDDQGELNNLVNMKPEIGQRLLSLIKDNLKRANERIIKGE